MADIIPATFSLSLPARLCAGPGSAVGSFPHGGTDLGDVMEFAFLPGARVEMIADESLGDEEGEGVIMSENCRLDVELSGLSAAMAAKIFANTTGAGGGGYGKGGDDSRLLSSGEFVLYMSPVFPSSQLGLVIYRASAHWGDTARLRARAGSTTGALVSFRGSMRHVSKGCYQMELPASLTV
jgi:hypothetical protein